LINADIRPAKLGTGIAGGASDHLAIAAAHDDVGDTGCERRPFRLASRWPWPLWRAISIKAASSMTGERRSSGPAINISSLAGEVSDQPAGRVGEDGQSLGEVSAKRQVGMRNQIGQNAINSST